MKRKFVCSIFWNLLIVQKFDNRTFFYKKYPIFFKNSFLIVIFQNYPYLVCFDFFSLSMIQNIGTVGGADPIWGVLTPFGGMLTGFRLRRWVDAVLTTRISSCNSKKTKRTAPLNDYTCSSEALHSEAEAFRLRIKQMLERFDSTRLGELDSFAMSFLRESRPFREDEHLRSRRARCKWNGVCDANDTVFVIATLGSRNV